MTVFLMFAAGWATQAQAAPSFSGVTANASSVQRLDKFELTFDLAGASFSNAFDPAQIDVTAVFNSPSAQAVTVNGFYHRAYTRSGPPEYLTAGAWSWKVRFSPQQTGAWTYSLQAVEPGPVTATYGPQTFTCTASARKGFVKIHPSDPRYLAYEDDSQFIPVGQNVGWANYGGVYGGGTFSYDQWIDKMADAGANFARYWMCPWYHSIEWRSTGLGDYTDLMWDAWRLDYDLELARSRDTTVMLALLNHGSVSSTVDPNWADSPYNAANGGPCAVTRDFFTDAAARGFWVRHLRYCVARWGYASNLIWEQSNEIDLTDGYSTDAGVRSDVASWLHDMAVTIKAMDAGRHLVTNSFSNSFFDPAVWNDPAIDFTQIHYYSGSSNLEDALRNRVASYRSSYPSKPVHVGEFGIPSGSAAVTQDPSGITFHNAMWGNLMNESTGTGAGWWWDNYVDPRNLYDHFRGLSAFASKLDFPHSGFSFTRPLADTETSLDLTVSPGLFFWCDATHANDFTVYSNGTMSPDVDRLSRYVYGTDFNTGCGNAPLTFRVVYPQAGQFRVALGVNSTAAPASLLIGVDGASAFSGPVTDNGTYAVSVAAGPRTITVASAGDDWLYVRSFTFSPCVAALKTYALQGPSTIAAWVLNRNYNASFVGTFGAPPALSGTLHFTGVGSDGNWNLLWYETRTGALVSQGLATASGGDMDVTVPSTDWDRGLIMLHGPAFTPLPTATPTTTVFFPRSRAGLTLAPNVLTDGAVARWSFGKRPVSCGWKVYTVAGQLARGVRSAGPEPPPVDFRGLSSGLYLVRVHVEYEDGTSEDRTFKVLWVR